MLGKVNMAFYQKPTVLSFLIYFISYIGNNLKSLMFLDNRTFFFVNIINN